MHLADDEVHHRSPSSDGPARSVGPASRARRARLPCTAGIDSETTVADERSQHTADVFGRVGVLRRARRTRSASARAASAKASPSRCVDAVVAAHHEAGVDQSLQRLDASRACRARCAPGSRSTSVAPSTSVANTRRRSSSARRPTSSRASKGDSVTRDSLPSEMVMHELPVDGVERILVVMAHPDDVDFGFAGSVAHVTDAGIEVIYCIVTDGDAGGAETGHPPLGDGGRCAATSSAPRRRSVGVARSPLPRLSRRPGRADARPPPRPRAGDPRRCDRSACVAQSTRSQLRPHLRERIPITSRSGGDARRRLSRRAQPLGASRARRRRARAVDRRRGVARRRRRRSRRTTSTSPTRSTARSRRCCPTRARCPIPAATETMVRSWTAANARAAGLPEGRFAEAVRVVDTR